MTESVKRPVLSLLASIMVVLMPVAGLTGCANDASDEGAAVQEAGQQVITAETIAGLKPGAQLVLDLRARETAYTFDFSQAPIDFSRITLIDNQGDAQRMDKWLSTSKENGRDLLAAREHQFQLAPTAQGFADLSAAERAQLQSTGTLVTRHNVSPLESGRKTEQQLECRMVPVWGCMCYPSAGYCMCSIIDSEMVCEDVEY